MVIKICNYACVSMAPLILISMARKSIKSWLTLTVWRSVHCAIANIEEEFIAPLERDSKFVHIAAPTAACRR